MVRPGPGGPVRGRRPGPGWTTPTPPTGRGPPPGDGRSRRRRRLPGPGQPRPVHHRTGWGGPADIEIIETYDSAGRHQPGPAHPGRRLRRRPAQARRRRGPAGRAPVRLRGPGPAAGAGAGGHHHDPGCGHPLRPAGPGAPPPARTRSGPPTGPSPAATTPTPSTTSTPPPPTAPARRWPPSTRRGRCWATPPGGGRTTPDWPVGHDRPVRPRPMASHRQRQPAGTGLEAVLRVRGRPRGPRRRAHGNPPPRRPADSMVMAPVLLVLVAVALFFLSTVVQWARNADVRHPPAARCRRRLRGRPPVRHDPGPVPTQTNQSLGGDPSTPRRRRRRSGRRR